MKNIIKIIKDYLILYPYYYIFKSNRYFKFNSKKYKYFFGIYNKAWITERAVEVPIIWKIVNRNRNKKILEIGNVLSHYFPVKHDILDKYEKGGGVINEDIVNFKPSKKYDLIVSISTLEHVGFDEKLKDNKKIISSIKNLKKILKKRGKMIITVPLGYNSYLDMYLKKGKIKFNEIYYLKRISRDNKWIETNFDDIKGARYNFPFHNANAIVIGVITK